MTIQRADESARGLLRLTEGTSTVACIGVADREQSRERRAIFCPSSRVPEQRGGEEEGNGLKLRDRFSDKETTTVLGEAASRSLSNESRFHGEDRSDFSRSLPPPPDILDPSPGIYPNCPVDEASSATALVALVRDERSGAYGDATTGCRITWPLVPSRGPS